MLDGMREIDLTSLEDSRYSYESDSQWLARKRFIERNINSCDADRLLCLAQLFININFLNCTYDKNLHAKVREMGRGIYEELFSSQRQRPMMNKISSAASKKQCAEMDSPNSSSDAHLQSRRKKFISLKAQMSLRAADAHFTDSLALLNQITTSVKSVWSIDIRIDSETTLRIDDVTVLRSRIPAASKSDCKYYAMIAALDSIVNNEAEVNVVDGRFELWHGLVGPDQYYDAFIANLLRRAAAKLPHEGDAFQKLQFAFNEVDAPMEYLNERMVGWNAKASIKVLNVELCSLMLSKGECSPCRQNEKKHELALKALDIIMNVEKLKLTPFNTYLQVNSC